MIAAVEHIDCNTNKKTVTTFETINFKTVWNFDNGNQPKYEPRFVGGSAGFRFLVYHNWTSRSYVGSRLCFEEERLAIHAGKKFTSWYKRAIIR